MSKTSRNPVQADRAGKPAAYARKAKPAKSRHDLIRDYVLAQITKGIWPEDFRIPTEVELGRQFNASKLTAHYALKSLRDKGYLRRTPGSGTFVARQSAYVTSIPQMDVVDYVRDRGGLHGVAILDRRVRLATQAEAALFRLQPGAELLHLRLLHSESGQPVQIEDRLINMSAAAGLLDHDITHETVFAYLMRLRPQRQGRETIRAREPVEDERALLKLGPDEPCLEIDRVTWNETEVVTAVRLIHPGSRFSLQGRIHSQDPA